MLNNFTKHLGINVKRLESGTVKLGQMKLLGALSNEYTLTGRRQINPSEPKQLIHTA
jgi:hypothetical protein